MKRLVLGESATSGDWYAVGPVYLDSAVEELRDLVEDRGDICRGIVNLLPAGEFKVETRRRLAAAAPAPAVADAGWDEEANAEGDAYLAELAEERAAEPESVPASIKPGHQLAYDVVGNRDVSTIYLGPDADDMPFESAVGYLDGPIGGVADSDLHRYPTMTAAFAGHRKLVDELRGPDWFAPSGDEVLSGGAA